jgi:hypothetical protein
MKWDIELNENDLEELNDLSISATCALCEIYYDPLHECKKCPIFHITGEQTCNETPYDLFAHYLDDGKLEEAIKYIPREKAFLENVQKLINSNDPCWKKYQKWELPI